MPNPSDHMLWGKLILTNIYLSIKQNLSYTWPLEPYALGKLILPINFLSIQQNLSHACFLGPHTLGKLTFQAIHKGVK